MLELDWKTLLFQVINFLVLLALLVRFLFRPLRAKLNERGRIVAETIQRARDQEAEAAQIRSQWQERMHTVEQQAEEMIQVAQREAQAKSANLLQEARIRMDRLTEEMRADLERHRNEIIVQHYDEILDTVMTLSGHVVQSVTTRRTHDDLVTNFCASIYHMPQSDVAEYRRIMSGRVPTAFVRTPVALTPEQSRTVEDTLSSLMDQRVSLRVAVDPSLVAGIQVRLGDKLMENSVRQQLTRIRGRVRRDLVARMGETEL
jgi:F-type H+-transporting ATPase subunit b